MKKIFTLIALAGITTAGFSQTQRMVLAEEFTNASCGPCASQNPNFNTLLSNNTSKVVSIKYQTNWPGVDPMNSQTQTDVSPRVTYYGVNGVPYAPIDGDTIAIQSPNYGGAPANWNQTVINNRYAVTSPFAISLTHNMSSDFDSIFISCTVTASTAATYTGPLKLHVAMIEKEIVFASAPGTNGETEFYNVMRKMYPNGNGTTLPLTWTNGQAQTYTFNAAVPAYIYDKNQIAVVAFVQDNSDKEVYQAAITTPVLVQHDAGIAAISSVPQFQCSSAINPIATIKNSGTATLTSAIVKYQIDNGPIDSISWTGSLATGATATVNLPAINVSAGAHTLKIFTVYPNGTADYNAANNQKTTTINIINTYTVLPLTENFQLTAFPPAGWMRINPDNSATWTRKTGAGGFATGSTQACAKMDFYNSYPGEVDELFAKPIDASNMTAPVNMTFDVAYAGYTASSPELDRLEVLYSTDCGNTWTSVYNKAGNTLKTANTTQSSFTPTATQWRTETISMNAVAGVAEVLVKFKATSDYGNNLYIDNLNLTGTPLSVKKNDLEDKFSIYPNPAASDPTVYVSLTNDERVKIEVYNLVGEVVSVPYNATMASGEHRFTMETSSLPSGIYYVKMTKGAETITKKITLAK